MKTSRAMVLDAPGQMRLQTFDVPAPQANGALLKVELAGICGTDVKVFKGKLPAYSTPVILGHEIVGRLEEVGEEMAERTGLAPGDRVTVSSMIPCWTCSSCMVGLYRFCPRMRQYGLSVPSSTAPHLFGAMSQYMYVLPGSMVRRLPEHVSSEAAILIEGVVANGFQWVRTKAGTRPPDVVLVQGCGPQGLGCVAVARECGASVVIVTGMARDHERLELAKRLGADHTLVADEVDVADAVRELSGGAGADRVIDVSGSPHAWEATIGAAGVGATVVVSGMMGADARVSMSTDEIIFKEITIKGALSKGADAIDDAGAFVAQGRVPVEEMVTHIFDLSEAEHAIRSVAGEVEGLYPVKAAVRP